MAPELGEGDRQPSSFAEDTGGILMGLGELAGRFPCPMGSLPQSTLVLNSVLHPMTGPTAGRTCRRTAYFPVLAEDQGSLVAPPRALLSSLGAAAPPEALCSILPPVAFFATSPPSFFLLMASLATFLLPASISTLPPFLRACALCRFAMISLLKR